MSFVGCKAIKTESTTDIEVQDSPPLNFETVRTDFGVHITQRATSGPWLRVLRVSENLKVLR